MTALLYGSFVEPRGASRRYPDRPGGGTSWRTKRRASALRGGGVGCGEGCPAARQLGLLRGVGGGRGAALRRLAVGGRSALGGRALRRDGLLPRRGFPRPLRRHLLLGLDDDLRSVERVGV